MHDRKYKKANAISQENKHNFQFIFFRKAYGVIHKNAIRLLDNLS